MVATYTNKATKETYELGGVKGIAQAWGMSRFVSDRKNWNFETFAMDVEVVVK